LMELIRKLRYFGYLDQIGISEREPGEVFEKVIEHLAATQDWSTTSVRTASGSDPVKSVGKKTKKAPRKSSKTKPSKIAASQPEDMYTELVKLHYIIDRRDFLEKVKSVYTSYAA